MTRCCKAFDLGAALEGVVGDKIWPSAVGEVTRSVKYEVAMFGQEIFGNTAGSLDTMNVQNYCDPIISMPLNTIVRIVHTSISNAKVSFAKVEDAWCGSGPHMQERCRSRTD